MGLIIIKSKVSDRAKRYDTDVKIEKVKYPLQKGDIVGKILIKDGEKVIDNVDLIVNEQVKKINFIKLYFRTLKRILSGELL